MKAHVANKSGFVVRMFFELIKEGAVRAARSGFDPVVAPSFNQQGSGGPVVKRTSSGEPTKTVEFS